MSRAPALDHLGHVVLPPLTGTLGTLWTAILDFAGRVAPEDWQLVGGQMVMLHGLLAGRTPDPRQR